MTVPHAPRSPLTPADIEYLTLLAQAAGLTSERGSLIAHHADDRAMVECLVRLKSHGHIIAGSRPGEEYWVTLTGLDLVRSAMGLAPAPAEPDTSAAEPAPQPRTASPALSAAPAATRAPARGPTRPVTSQDVVASLVPNPKRAGTAAHARYALWRVGMTVQQALDAGITRADIAHDMGRGYVLIAPAD